MTALEIIGHVSFAIGAVSYWVRDEIWLRSLLILSFVTGIAYNALPPVGPLWIVVFWLAVYTAINGLRIASSLRERRGVRLDEAETLITAALAITPNDAFIQDSLGWLRFKQGKLDEALEVLQRAYALRADPEIAAHLSEVLWARGDRDAAAKLLRVALIESPNNESLVAAIKRFLP